MNDEIKKTQRLTGTVTVVGSIQQSPSDRTTIFVMPKTLTFENGKLVAVKNGYQIPLCIAEDKDL